ncbi:MAG: hypothetical protein ABH826_00645 [Patescibacteria group bacterium]
MKYARLDLGQVEAIVNKLGGMEGVQRFLRGELEVTNPTRTWREEDGVIYLSVTSDGTTGEEWIKRLEELSKYAKDVLLSSDFVPTDGMTYEIAVLKGTLFSDSDRVTSKIRVKAEARGFTKPNAEIACLIRDKFSNAELKKMGLYWIAVMHEPIKDSDGDPNLLCVNRNSDGSWLFAAYGRPGYTWGRDDGFAFVVSQVST